MIEVAQAALECWGLADAKLSLAAARENHVFRVHTADGDFALRVHRRGYRSDAELNSELDWMTMVAAGGLWVPRPVVLPSGGWLTECRGYQIDLLSWCPGDTLTATIEPDGVNRGLPHLSRLGETMAKLHLLSDAWERPEKFDRPKWDHDGLLGAAPLWGRFWANPTLDRDDHIALQDFRDRASHRLIACQDELDFGLIHADLIPDNVLVDNDRLHLIDFDDGGFGYRLFELATALIRYIEMPEYEAIKQALLEGYLQHRMIDLSHFDLFMGLRAVTNLGWIADRLTEAGARERNEKAIRIARKLALAPDF